MGTIGGLRRKMDTVRILRLGGWEGWLGLDGGRCSVLVWDIIFMSGWSIIVGSTRVEWLYVSVVWRRHVQRIRVGGWGWVERGIPEASSIGVRVEGVLGGNEAV
jgi:hypothetical protein